MHYPLYYMQDLFQACAIISHYHLITPDSLKKYSAFSTRKKKVLHDSFRTSTIRKKRDSAHIR